MKSILIFGSTGAIGSAFIEQFSKQENTVVHAVSRKSKPIASVNEAVISHELDFSDAQAIANLASKIDAPLDLIIVAIGTLHSDSVQPEKSLSQLSFTQFEQVFMANTFIPAMLIKEFVPKLSQAGVFSLLSARVGSISDNRLGGWYAYRASKAALNMLIKTTAIEISRRNKHRIIVGLHPGTVDSNLSKPFQSNVPDEKLFSPEYSAKHLIDVISQLTPEDSGKCFAWDGKEILA